MKPNATSPWVSRPPATRDRSPREALAAARARVLRALARAEMATKELQSLGYELDPMLRSGAWPLGCALEGLIRNAAACATAITPDDVDDTVTPVRLRLHGRPRPRASLGAP